MKNKKLIKKLKVKIKLLKKAIEPFACQGAVFEDASEEQEIIGILKVFHFRNASLAYEKIKYK